MGTVAPAVVTGTDGSASASAALAQAAWLAKSERSSLHVVSAYSDDAGRERAEAALAAARELPAAEGIELEVHLVAGDPATALIEVADLVDARLIVVGNRGTETLLPWRRAIFEDVEKRAGCPVLVVDTESLWRPPEPEKASRIGREW